MTRVSSTIFNSKKWKGNVKVPPVRFPSPASPQTAASKSETGKTQKPLVPLRHPTLRLPLGMDWMADGWLAGWLAEHGDGDGDGAGNATM